MLNKLPDATNELTMLKMRQNDFKRIDSSTMKDSQLREKTDQFESIILKTLLDVSMKDSNKLFGEDAGDKIYQSMFRDELSKMSAGGFGISETLFNFLKEQEKQNG
ncbi:Rod binding protein [Thiovulum sp. ES]|jgi:flagellar protein FlgJ|nr:Rod binding protein [Thiovulum sp. ES]